MAPLPSMHSNPVRRPGHVTAAFWAPFRRWDSCPGPSGESQGASGTCTRHGVFQNEGRADCWSIWCSYVSRSMSPGWAFRLTSVNRGGPAAATAAAGGLRRALRSGLHLFRGVASLPEASANSASAAGLAMETSLSATLTSRLAPLSTAATHAQSCWRRAHRSCQGLEK